MSSVRYVSCGHLHCLNLLFSNLHVCYELPNMIVEAVELQKFKLGANVFLFGVDGP